VAYTHNGSGFGTDRGQIHPDCYTSSFQEGQDKRHGGLHPEFESFHALCRVNATTPTTLAPASSATTASGSSFYAAMRILPPPQREAMYEIYAFCRKVDDVADGGGSREMRRSQLEEWRAAIDACYGLTPPQALASLAEQIRAFGLLREDFMAVIDGMQMDVDTNIVAPSWATLDLYCDRVASAVGRLSVRVFGLAHDSGVGLAYHLGRALQLTNIVRDVDEDALIGRLYLPKEELAAAGVDTSDVSRALADPALAIACEAVARRSRGHFLEADRLMDASPRRAVRAPRLMAAAYQDLLRRMLAKGFLPPRVRVRVSKFRLARAILTYAVL